MSIRLLNAKRLAEELGRGEVSPRGKAYYLFVSIAMWVLINVTGFTTASPLWSAMSLIETVVLLLIIVLGFTYAYEAAGGDKNADFVSQFICLYVPVSITTVVAVWAIYWGGIFAFRESIIAISESQIQFAINLSRMGSSFSGGLVLLAVLAVEAITFYRITKLFRIVRSQAGAVNSLLQATPDSGRA
jgi:hypothetical protein